MESNLSVIVSRLAFSIALFFIGFSSSISQTIVTGVVKDAATGQPIAAASVMFRGGKGTATDSMGTYRLSTSNLKYTQLQISYVGYSTEFINFEAGKETVINCSLKIDLRYINSVTVSTSKRAPYKNKGNPAVELINKVIEHRAENRATASDFLSYTQYEKLTLSMSNFSDKITASRLLNQYKFLFDNRDTTTIEGRILLPVYIQETISKKWWRKNPAATKTLVEAEKQVDFGSYVDNKGINLYLNRLYMDVDIYENNIPLFTYQFLSPIASLSPTFYLFYIRDTITDASGEKFIKLYFTPRNTGDLLFRGNMLITLDGRYAVKSINLFISKNANLNFVREMNIDLNFQKNSDGKYDLIRSKTGADAGINRSMRGGIYGERTVSFQRYDRKTPIPDSVFSGAPLVRAPDAASHGSNFWEQNRHDSLKKTESAIYTNIDSLTRMRSYQRTMGLMVFLVDGYVSLGPVEWGPFAAFYSFNPVEGFKPRLGGRTTTQFSKRIFLEGYGAYGLKDEQFKYFLRTTYSLNNKSIYQYPLSFIRASYQYDTKIPGQELQFVSEDNFLLSFKRGLNDKWLYNRNLVTEYVHEFPRNVAITLGGKNWIQQPAGSIVYNKTSNGIPVQVKELTTTELYGEVRWAPHEQFYQSKVYRIPIVNQYPIYTLRFIAGVKGVLNSEFAYQNLSGRVEKRVYLSRFGYSDVVVEGGYIFGKLPYPLITIHRANQTYSFMLESYNLMNFQEFVSDHYFSVNINHYFNGLLLNRVPLVKKLKLREVVSLKMLYGGVRAENDPRLDKELIQFPQMDGHPTTFTLEAKPYLEGSVGITNLLKLFRVDIVKRFSYLENPSVSPWGLRARFKFDF